MAETPRQLTVVTPASDVRTYPRMNKLLEVLTGMGTEVAHWYWRRAADGDEADARIAARRRLLDGGGYANRRLALRYPAFMWRAFRQILGDGEGRRFYCLGFAAALPAAVASLFARRTYLFDNNDNVSLSYRGPAPLRALLAAVERFVARRAAVHLVPASSRWDRPEPNLRVVPNVPTRAVLERARETARREGYRTGDIFTLYVTGLLTDARGARQLLDVLGAWDASIPLRILVSGRLRSAAAEELAGHARVEYLGQLDNETALARYACAHAVLTYYDPAVEINRLAEPNKWGDCVAMGVPFVVNGEVETSRPFVEAGACFAAPYHDADALRVLLEDLIADEGRLAAARKALGNLDWKPWDERMRDVLGEL